MRHLLLLVAMVAAGQTLPTHIPSSGQPITLGPCKYQTPDAVMFCATKGPIHYNYRIDWLRPDLRPQPFLHVYRVGDGTYVWGYEPVSYFYIQAPTITLEILLPNGKRVTISRAEIDGRAK